MMLWNIRITPRKEGRMIVRRVATHVYLSLPGVSVSLSLEERKATVERERE